MIHPSETARSLPSSAPPFGPAEEIYLCFDSRSDESRYPPFVEMPLDSHRLLSLATAIEGTGLPPFPIVLAAAWYLLLQRFASRPLAILVSGKEVCTSSCVLQCAIESSASIRSFLSAFQQELQKDAFEAASDKSYGFSFSRDGDTLPLTAKAMTLCCVQDSRSGKYSASIVFDNSRVTELSAQGLIAGLITIAEEAVMNPDQDHGSLALKENSDEAAWMKTVVNNTFVRQPPRDTVLSLFTGNATSFPNRSTLECEGRILNADETWRRAKQIAARLQQQWHVLPGEIVAVRIRRNEKLIVTLLAIWHTGAAYLPIDADCPADRMDFMIRDSNARGIITQSLLEEWWAQEDIDISNRQFPMPDADSAAYIIYTSGTTNRPKGVVVLHRSLVNYCNWFCRISGLTEKDSTLLFSSIAFDLSYTALWPALVTGTAIHLMDDQNRLEPEELRCSLIKNRITFIKLTPSHFTYLTEDVLLDEKEKEYALRLIVLGGELIRMQDVQKWLRLFPLTRFVHHYGPTETTIGAIAFPLDASSVDRFTNFPVLGRPIDNTAIYILNDRQQRVPMGTSGEIAIAGAGVAIGYLHLHELNAQRFLADHFSGSGRMYRTGDRGRFLPDGTVAFEGRVDDEVKLRGYRVGLLEVEAALREQAGVADVCIAAAGTKEDPFLIAYVVPDPNEQGLTARMAERQLLYDNPGKPSLLELPGGRPVVVKNVQEAEYMIEDIFRANTYLKHGIVVRDGDCVLDVGANIGFFSLHLLAGRPRLSLYAFEPMPEIFELLSTNLHLHAPGAKAFQVAIGAESATSNFRYYPHVTLMSGKFADTKEETAVLRGFLKHSEKETLEGELVDQLLEDRLQYADISCTVRTISQVMAEQGIEKVHLLKIDVQKSELEVLLGIEEQDWDKIEQVVIEVHDLEDRLTQIRSLLMQHGFLVTSEQNNELQDTVLHMLYAKRLPGLERSKDLLQLPARTPQSFMDTLLAKLGERLPAYMIPEKIVFMPGLPLLPNGKLNRKALPADAAFVPAIVTKEEYADETEKILAGIWEEVLEIKEPGRHDDFFALGGHSLKAIRLIGRVHKRMKASLKLKDIFNSPTIARLAETIRSSDVETVNSIPVLVPQSLYEVSSVQKRMWIIDQINEGKEAYNITLAFSLAGQLEKTAFADAIRFLMRRHEILRTAIIAKEGQPFQQIFPPGEDIPLIELDFRNGVDHGQKIAALCELEARKPFQLHNAPLFRVTLVQTADSSYICLFSLHHIISDGWTSDILFRELTTAYNHYLAHRNEPSWTALPVQYKDFAAWQNRILQSPAITVPRTYWKKKMEGELPVLSLPEDNSRPVVQVFEGRSLGMEIPADLYMRLPGFCRQHGVTLFTALLATVKIILLRYTGQTDLIVGSPVSGRTHHQLTGLAGCFVNTLPMRTLLQATDTFVTVLQKVHTTVLEALEHGIYPFERIVEDIGVARDMSRSGIFDILVSHRKPDPLFSNPEAFSGLEWEALPLSSKTAKFDWTIDFVERPDQLWLEIEYNSAIYEEHTIQRLAGHFINLLKAALDLPNAAIASLPFLSGDEIALLAAYNNTSCDLGQHVPIHTRFANIAAKEPERIAVEHNGESISYGELNEKANRIAQYIAARITTKPAFAAVHLERGIPLITALLGILKAGAVYMPIDVQNPPGRVKQMLDRANPLFLFTHASFLDTPGLYDGIPHTLVMDGKDNASLASLSTNDPEKNVNPNDPACLLFTSGSTGLPKGVVLTHEGVVNHILSEVKVLDLPYGFSFLQSAALSSDISLWQMVGPLLYGGTTMVIDRHDVLDYEKLITRIREQRIMLVELVPSYLVGLIGYLTAAGPQRPLLPDLRWIMICGEELPVRMVNDWLALYPETRVVNAYGPAEASDDVAQFIIDKRLDDACRKVPIGKPLPNLNIHILDEWLNQMPPGIKGEICISGIGVGLGYWNDPERTALAFTANPVPGSNGTVIYRTGDFGRWTPGGQLEFHGRSDSQIKIRGFRVEPGEIETQIKSHFAVSDAIVLAKKDKQGQVSLTGWIAFRQEYDSREQLAAIRAYLEERLPVYMIPASLGRVDKFKLNLSDKTDREVLAGMEAEEESTAPLLPPEGAREEELAAVIRSVLGKPFVGRNDSFFEIGGDSIKAIQIVSRLSQQQWMLDIRSIFRHPRLKDMALQLQPKIRTAEQGRVSGPVPMTPAIADFLSGREEDPGHFNQSLLLFSEHRIELQLIQQAIDAAFEQHDMLGALLRETNGRAELYLPETVIPPVVIQFDLRDEAAAAEKLAALAQSIQENIDPCNGSMMAVALFRMTDGDRLLIVLHHLVIDGLSWRILLEDLEFGYSRRRQGLDAALPLKSDSFRLWASRLNDFAASKMIAAERSYWKEIEKETRLSIGPWTANGYGYFGKTEICAVRLEKEETSLLLTSIHRTYNTGMNDILLCSLVRAMKEYFDIAQFPVWMEGHGRESLFPDLDVSRTVGWFTSEYPIILKASGNASIDADIITTKEMLRNIPNNGIGYGLLKWISPKEEETDLDGSKPPISFNYWGQTDEPQTDAVFRLSDLHKGEDIGGSRRRPHWLDIKGLVTDGQLEFVLVYNPDVFSSAVAAGFSECFRQSLLELITFCTASTENRPTPSDFSYSKLSMNDLDSLFQ